MFTDETLVANVGFSLYVYNGFAQYKPEGC